MKNAMKSHLRKKCRQLDQTVEVTQLMVEVTKRIHASCIPYSRIY